MAETEKKPRKPRTVRTVLAPGVTPPESDLQDTRFVSANPTTGDDLMAIWDLPPAAASQGRVKILRKDYASSMQTIVGECSVADYSMAATAGKWGPGEYVIQLSPSPAKLWGIRSSSVRVSPQYAEAEGWDPMPLRPTEVAPVRVSNLQTYETVAAKDGPMTPVQIASLVETLLDRMEARRQPVAPPQDMAAMFGMFSNFQRIQEQAEERARANMAVFAKMAAPAVGSEWAEVAREVLPSLVPVLGSIAGAIMQKNLPPPPPPPAIELDDAEDDDLPPEPQEPTVPPGTTVTIPLSLPERAYLAPAVGMFGPFIGHVLTIIRQKGPDEGAKELVNFIPGMMIPRIKKLCEWQREKGLEVMAAVNPAFMTKEAVSLLENIVKLAEGTHTSGLPVTTA